MTPPPSQSNLLSGSPEKALLSMLDVMKGLKSIYREESDAVRKRDVQTFLKLQPSKEVYTRDYELLAKEIKARSASIKKADMHLRERLISEQHELTSLAEESICWCLRMADSLKRVQDRLIMAAREAIQKEKSGYGSSGEMDESGRPVATAFNEAY